MGFRKPVDAAAGIGSETRQIKKREPETGL